MLKVPKKVKPSRGLKNCPTSITVQTRRIEMLVCVCVCACVRIKRASEDRIFYSLSAPSSFPVHSNPISARRSLEVAIKCFLLKDVLRVFLPSTRGSECPHPSFHVEMLNFPSSRTGSDEQPLCPKIASQAFFFFIYFWLLVHSASSHRISSRMYFLPKIEKKFQKLSKFEILARL